MIFLLLGFLAPLDVVISEISWMGNNDSYSNEWIELYNKTDFPIDLEGWKISSRNNNLEIQLEGEIAEKSFYLIERTNDNAVLEVLADKIYKGSLNNNGENLELLNASGDLIDSVDCSSGWFFGDNETKQTMERRSPLIVGSDPGNWQDSIPIKGTPKAKNSKYTILNKEIVPQKTIQKEKQNFFFPWSALIIAVMSGIIILGLKKKIKKTYNKNI